MRKTLLCPPAVPVHSGLTQSITLTTLALSYGWEMEKMESTYNRFVKNANHRQLIEPLPGLFHMRKTLMWRYQGFIRKIQNSKKKALRNLLSLVKNDVRKTTWSNLRKIMLLSGKNIIAEVLNSRLDFEYHKLEEEEVWKVLLRGKQNLCSLGFMGGKKLG